MSGAWLARVRELQSLAQAGLTYSRDPYDLERYARLRGLAAEMLAELGGADPERVRLQLEAETGYLTPKLDVRAAVHDDEGRVLLVREVQDGRWTLPGGWADVGESLAEGAVREVREESGYVVELDRLLGFYERERWGHPPLAAFTLKAVVACRLVGGEPTPSTETDAIGWYARDDVPPLSVGRCSPQLLARVFEHLDESSLPPDID
jgi:ADP-ribose pyrophosphatase YjhB (NUDIX family)